MVLLPKQIIMSITISYSTANWSIWTLLPRLGVSILLAMSLGCGRGINSSSLPSQIYSNGSGARVADAAKAQSASLFAQANGISVDTLNFTRNIQTTGGIIVESTLQFGDGSTLPIYTTHYNLGVVVGQIPYRDLVIETSAQCANVNCDRYFLILEITKNGELVIEEGIKHDFLQPSNSRYQWLSPEDWLSFASMVKFLGGY